MQKLGLYVHYPFCKKICPYCDFNVYSSSLAPNEDVILQCYKRDLDYFYSKMTHKKLSTIYFGGGTPSLMNSSLVGGIIEYANKLFCFEENIEISIEANPLDIKKEKFAELRQIGINRVSVGIQSFNDRELAFLGREHNAKQSLEAISVIANIFENFTYDLIYSLPNQTLKQWEKNLNTAISLNSKHLSLYTLTIEENTPFWRFVQSGAMQEKDQSEVADFIDFTWNFMKENGFIHYEVSNFAKTEKFQSRHNQLYWTSSDYIGIGAGAHGCLFYDDGRYETLVNKSLRNWLNREKVYFEEKLTQQSQVKEIIISGFRSNTGIEIEKINQLFNVDVLNNINDQAINELINLQMIEEQNGKLKSTEKGMLFLNYIYKCLLT
jgi:putative oxygen-independent coproporphyrinogen III oxidase